MKVMDKGTHIQIDVDYEEAELLFLMYEYLGEGDPLHHFGEKGCDLLLGLSEKLDKYLNT